MIEYTVHQSGKLTFESLGISQSQYIIRKMLKSDKVTGLERLTGWPTKFVIWFGLIGCGTNSLRFHGFSERPRGKQT